MKEGNPYYDESMWKGAPSESFKKARQLRENMTSAEKMLWDQLKADRFRKYKFRRQHPIQCFIVDFYSHQLKLFIEVDGKYHEDHDQQIKDQERTEVLQFQGLQMIRFTNEEITEELDKVLLKLEDVINRKI